MHPIPEPTTPLDFPSTNSPGAVSGVQPKLSVRKIGDKYVSGLTEEEVYARYDACFDLVNQLVDYCHRKRGEHPEWAEVELFRKVRAGVAGRKDWDFSNEEHLWMMTKLCIRMNWPAPGN
jgi:hypothetical protein